MVMSLVCVPSPASNVTLQWLTHLAATSLGCRSKLQDPSHLTPPLTGRGTESEAANAQNYVLPAHSWQR